MFQVAYLQSREEFPRVEPNRQLEWICSDDLSVKDLEPVDTAELVSFFVFALMNDAAGAAQGVKREVDAVVRNQAEKILRDLDIVKREEFEAVKDMARLAREENEALKARIAVLEAKLGVSASAPDSGSPKTEG